jgi:hypothetical protein
MTDQERLDKLTELLKNQDILEVIGVDNINHDPHQFVIGPKHVTHAADNHSGMLGQVTLEAIPCARCGWKYHRHTFNKVAFLRLKRDCNNDELSDVIKSLSAEVEKLDIEGFVFVESKEKFKIK